MGAQGTFAVSIIDDSAKGVQGSLAYCQAMKDFMGLQAAFLTMSKDFSGLQASGVGIADEVTGMQASFFSFSKGCDRHPGRRRIMSE